jgi:replication factor C subunit 3/5
LFLRVNITEDGRQALLNLAHGDMRRVLNILQSTSMAFDKVTEETVYTCVGHPLRSDIANIISWMLNEDFTAAYSKIRDLQTFKGLALQDILTEVHLYVHQSNYKMFKIFKPYLQVIYILPVDFPPNVRIVLLEKMADVEVRLSSGCSDRIQLGSLLSAFDTARCLVAKQVA